MTISNMSQIVADEGSPLPFFFDLLSSSITDCIHKLIHFERILCTCMTKNYPLSPIYIPPADADV